MNGDRERNSAVQALVEKMNQRDEQTESTDDGPTTAEIADHLRSRKGR